jgi:hypothetical protein
MESREILPDPTTYPERPEHWATEMTVMDSALTAWIDAEVQIALNKIAYPKADVSGRESLDTQQRANHRAAEAAKAAFDLARGAVVKRRAAEREGER